MSKLTLSDILNDRTSGASQLYHQTLTLLLTDKQYENPNQARRVVDRLIKKFPEMVGFAYLKSRLKGLRYNNMSDVLQQLLNSSIDETALILKNLKTIWRSPRRIVTFSKSSVVLFSLLANKTNVKSVLISCAAPRNEGILMARELTSRGIDVELVTDAALPGLIKRKDYIILGADCVTERYFVNKIGTYPLLLAAQAAEATSMVLHESFKRVSSKQFPFVQSLSPRQEILKTRKPRKLTVTNAYFEAIDNCLVDYFISGDGTNSK